MSYQVLARKWRPRQFDQVVGQDHVLRALTNALDSDRLHHAYLFTGTRGVGKTSLARVFAKALNCEAGVSSRPCDECGACREVDEGRFVDLIEVDAASRTKVDETRELLENVQYAATRGRFKIYLIDEVHMFSTHSFNALLKTLEEPPDHVKFLLATTDPKKLPVTILSRCLQFNLKRVAPSQLQAQLDKIVEAESITSEDAALRQLSVAADGSVRDALSLLDQAIAYGGGQVRESDVSAMLGTLDGGEINELINALAANDGRALIETARRLAERAPDFDYVLGEILSTLRRIAVAQTLASDATAVEDDSNILAFATEIDANDVQLFYQIALVGRRDLALAPDPQAGFEMVLMRMLAFRLSDGGRPARVSPDPRTRATEEPPRPAPDPTPAASPTPPTVTEQASAAAAPPVESTLAVDFDWHTTVDQLTLNGMVRELARNAAVSAFNGKILDLVVEPQHENLQGERLLRGLEKALREQLALEAQIRISVAAADSLDTPAKRMTAAEVERQKAAEADIAGDPSVQNLQAEFGATIETVSPK